MLRRDSQFEREFYRLLSNLKMDADLKSVLTSLVSMLGKEIDYIEKNVTGTSSPVSASGGTVIVQGQSVIESPATIISGVIAVIQKTVVAGSNTITFLSPLASVGYNGYLVLADSAGFIIDSASLNQRSTGKTKTGFTYNATEAGTLSGFALVES